MKEKISFAVIFDMDGTLLKTEEVAIPAFKQTFQSLKEEGLYTDSMPTEEDLTSVFGMTLEEIWNKLLPGQGEEVRKKADQWMLKNELALLKEGGIHLYPEVRETITTLREESIPLFIASNGLDEYIRGVCDCFQMSDFFQDLYSAGRFQTESKDDLVAKLLSDFNIEHAVMVGDRKSDIQAGRANGLVTIGCGYGFADRGELANADVIVEEFKEILPLIHNEIRAKKNRLK